MKTTTARKILLALILFHVLGILTAQHSAYGVTKSWSDPTGGLFNDPNNWSPNGVPSSTEDVRFGLEARYGVGFPANASVGEVFTHNKSLVTWSPFGPDLVPRNVQVNGLLRINNSSFTLNGGLLNTSVTDGVIVDGVRGARDSGNLSLIGGAVLSSKNASFGTLADMLGHGTISGDGTHWDVQQNLRIGEQGGASVELTDGASIKTLRTQIGVESGSRLHATQPNSFKVTGVGESGEPTRLNTSYLEIGMQGQGSTTVSRGAEVSALRISLAQGRFSTGRLLISDPANPQESVVHANRLFAGEAGFGEIHVFSGGKLNNEIARLGIEGIATIRVDGQNKSNPASWTIEETLRVGEAGTGMLTIAGGGQVHSGSTEISTASGATGRVFIGGHEDLTSAWNNPGDLWVGGDQNGPGGAAYLTMIENSQTNIGQTMTIWPQGTVTLNGGDLAVDTVDNSHGGVFAFESGSLQTERVRGNLDNQAGWLVPGPDAGATVISGNYTQGDDATLQIEIGGKLPGSTHDLISIGGTADVDGSLSLSLIDDFVPQPTDAFTVFGANQIVGLFENATTGQRLDTNDGRGSFLVHYGLGSEFDENRIILTDFLPHELLLGDFNNNGLLDAKDMDLLSVATGGGELLYDLTSDGLIDDADRDVWVHDLKQTLYGDADLNHSVDFADFLTLSSNFGGSGGWAAGDFDGNGEIGFGDFLQLSENFGMSTTPPTASSVPEPQHGIWLLVVACVVASRRRPQRGFAE